MDIKKELGNKIRTLRRARGLSQEVLAELSGLHPTYISGIECGKRNVSLENIRSLAKGLGISLADLFADFKR